MATFRPWIRLAPPYRDRIVIAVDRFCNDHGCRDREPNGREASVVEGEPHQSKNRSERRLQAAATRGPGSMAFKGSDGLLSSVTSVKPTALS